MKGKIIINEKSENKLFQWTLWQWPNGGYTVQIKKFKRERDGRVNYFNFEEINLRIPELRYFKDWIKNDVKTNAKKKTK